MPSGPTVKVASDSEGRQRDREGDGSGGGRGLEGGQAEVENPGVAVGLDDDVRRFQVAVNHPRLVGVVQALGHRGHHLDRGPDVRLREMMRSGGGNGGG